MESISIWVPLLVAFIGTFTGILSLILTAKNRQAEATKLEGDASRILTEASVAIVKQYREEFDILKADLRKLENEVQATEAQSKMLKIALEATERRFEDCQIELDRKTDEIAILVQQLQARMNKKP